MSDFCIDCEHYRAGFCGLRNIYTYPPDRINCDKFAPRAVKTVVLQDNGWRIIEEKKQSLFDRITESPEVLAPKFVYYTVNRDQFGTYYWYCSALIPGEKWSEKAEAIAATVEKLKEVRDE